MTKVQERGAQCVAGLLGIRIFIAQHDNSHLMALPKSVFSDAKQHLFRTAPLDVWDHMKYSHLGPFSASASRVIVHLFGTDQAANGLFSLVANVGPLF